MDEQADWLFVLDEDGEISHPRETDARAIAAGIMGSHRHHGGICFVSGCAECVRHFGEHGERWNDPDSRKEEAASRGLILI